jgi:hypothetical protein
VPPRLGAGPHGIASKGKSDAAWGPAGRPPARPNHVQIEHHKPGKLVWHPLQDEDGRFYPEIEDYLAELPKLGVPIALTPGTRGENRPYSYSYARALVRRARKKAGLPTHVTLTACRHGGMTELGDAKLTEQGIITLSAHTTPDAARGYVKKTERQRLAAARKRRAWVEQERIEAGTSALGRRLAKLMRDLGWTAVKARSLSQSGFRDQVRGYACEKPRVRD